MTLSINITKWPMTVLIGAAIGLFALSLVAVSSAHDGNSNPNLVHACVLDSNSTVRIVGTSTECETGETAQHWNTEGAPGLGGLVDDVVGADFGSADMRYRSIAGRDWTGAQFSATNLTHADVSNANFTNAQMSLAILRGSTGWSSVTFSNTDMSRADLGLVDLSGKDLRSVILTGAQIDDSNMANTDLDHNDLTNTNMFRANFSGADFSDAELEDAVMDGGNFTNTNLAGATNATHVEASTWGNTICPDGTNSDNNSDTCEGHLTP